MKKLFQTRNDVALLLLRLALGIVMFPHGAQKALGLWGGHGFSATVSAMSHQFPAFLVVLAIAAEFLGSIGLIAGFLTRIAAAGIIVNMLVAITQVHLPNGFFMNWGGKQGGEGIEYHILVIAMALVLVIWGGGAASVDRGIAAGEGKKRV